MSVGKKVQYHCVLGWFVLNGPRPSPRVELYDLVCAVLLLAIKIQPTTLVCCTNGLTLLESFLDSDPYGDSCADLLNGLDEHHAVN